MYPTVWRPKAKPNSSASASPTVMDRKNAAVLSFRFAAAPIHYCLRFQHFGFFHLQQPFDFFVARNGLTRLALQEIRQLQRRNKLPYSTSSTKIISATFTGLLWPNGRTKPFLAAFFQRIPIRRHITSLVPGSFPEYPGKTCMSGTTTKRISPFLGCASPSGDTLFVRTVFPGLRNATTWSYRSPKPRDQASSLLSVSISRSSSKASSVFKLSGIYPAQQDARVHDQLFAHFIPAKGRKVQVSRHLLVRRHSTVCPAAASSNSRASREIFEVLTSSLASRLNHLGCSGRRISISVVVHAQATGRINRPSLCALRSRRGHGPAVRWPCSSSTPSMTQPAALLLTYADNILQVG